MAQSGGTFSCAHRRIQSQKELRLQSRKGSPKPLPPNFVCWLGTLVAPYFGADDAVSTDNGLKAIGFFYIVLQLFSPTSQLILIICLKKFLF
jgi:hypothetical protein